MFLESLVCSFYFWKITFFSLTVSLVYFFFSLSPIDILLWVLRLTLSIESPMYPTSYCSYVYRLIEFPLFYCCFSLMWWSLKSLPFVNIVWVWISANCSKEGDSCGDEGVADIVIGFVYVWVKMGKAVDAVGLCDPALKFWG